MDFSEKLQTLREMAGLSRPELVTVLGCSEQSIYAWERGVRNPKPLRFAGLAAALGVPLKDLKDYLFGNGPLPTPSTGTPLILSVWHKLNASNKEVLMRLARQLLESQPGQLGSEESEPGLELQEGLNALESGQRKDEEKARTLRRKNQK